MFDVDAWYVPFLIQNLVANHLWEFSEVQIPYEGESPAVESRLYVLAERTRPLLLVRESRKAQRYKHHRSNYIRVLSNA